MEIYCKVTALGLIPLYDSDLEEKKRLGMGKIVKCKIVIPRNYEFHKKFFALVRLVFENLPERTAKDLEVHSEHDMLNRIKYDLGMYDILKIGGDTAIRFRSISFPSMDNTEFERFYNLTLDLVLTKYLRGNTREELLDEINNFR